MTQHTRWPHRLPKRLQAYAQKAGRSAARSSVGAAFIAKSLVLAFDFSSDRCGTQPLVQPLWRCGGGRALFFCVRSASIFATSSFGTAATAPTNFFSSSSGISGSGSRFAMNRCLSRSALHCLGRLAHRTEAASPSGLSFGKYIVTLERRFIGTIRGSLLENSDH